ncbi:MAG: metal-dependent hydrolase [Deltaproteobacteria bacterium]|jgi:L-ascorbate metabolism protein UlaG (beta-lactamase superfamily)|nr:metal-dependent hydrolase [Deltaproteobacteria bacterium]
MATAKITYFGHSAFHILTANGIGIWIDPWLENPLAPEGIHSGLACDIILVTHGHGDHLGNCIAMARNPGTEVVVIHELQQYLLGKGLPNVTGMNIGGTYTTKTVTITMTQAIHSSSFFEAGEHHYAGCPAGFVIRTEDGLSIYHAGDTALFGDMALISELYRPDLAMLPIGGHYVMGPKEAAHAVRFLNVKKVIPMHYASFPVLKGTPDNLKEELKRLGLESDVIALSPGGYMELQATPQN